MAKTNLNMQLLLRRDNVFTSTYKLAAGEPGFEISTNTFKIGDGTHTWAELPIANKAAIDALIKATDDKLEGYKPLQEVISAVETAANTFVDTIAQDANGKITITTKSVDFSAADDRFKKLQTAIAAVATAKNVFVEQIAQDAQGVITITTKAVDFSDYRTAADQDVIDATFKTKQEAYSAEGSTIKTVTKVEQNANGEVEVTYENIAFPAVPNITIADDTAAEIPETETVNVYKNLSANGHALTEELVEVATAKGVEAAKGAAEAADAKAEAAQKGVDDLEKYVGTFPETTLGDGTKVETVVGYINAKTAGIATDANLKLLEDRLTTIEEAPYATAADINAINDEETGILAQAKAYVDAEDKFFNGITTVNALGGIGANVSLDNMTTHEILETLLFPYVAPSITSKSRTAAAATLENGATQLLSSCSITVAKKSKAIKRIALYNGSDLLEEQTGDSLNGTYSFSDFDTITVSKSNNPNLKFVVDDESKASAATANVGASTFVYPYYWGVCAADAIINEALVESLAKKVESKANKTDIAFTCENQKIVFAYPKTYGVLKSIIDPNNFETIDGYARSEVSITGLDGSAQSYYVYVQKDPCTVTGFKVDFKY